MATRRAISRPVNSFSGNSTRSFATRRWDVEPKISSSPEAGSTFGDSAIWTVFRSCGWNSVHLKPTARSRNISSLPGQARWSSSQLPSPARILVRIPTVPSEAKKRKKGTRIEAGLGSRDRDLAEDRREGPARTAPGDRPRKICVDGQPRRGSGSQLERRDGLHVPGRHAEHDRRAIEHLTGRGDDHEPDLGVLARSD